MTLAEIGGIMSTNQKVIQRINRQHLRPANAWKIPGTQHRLQSTFRRALSNSILSYCRDTSLHGVRNLVDDLRQLGSTRYSKQQKLVNLISLTIWISACAIGAVFATTLIGLAWTRFLSTPTITTIETNHFPIWKINFPAVTICNNNKVYRPAADRIKQMLVKYNLDPDILEKFLMQLSKLVVPEFTEDKFLRTHAQLLLLNYTTERLMFELMQPCHEMLSNCSWLGKPQPCESLFRVAKSSEGFCCSFNYKAPLDALEVETEHEYIDEQLDIPVYRVSGAGQHVGLKVLIHVAALQYVSYSKAYHGAAILIHGTQDFPHGADKATVGQPGTDVTVSVIPSIVVSEKSVRSLALNKRNCYFDDEIKLRTTKKYTYPSCISECAVDTILAICKCLPFYYAEVHLREFSSKHRQCTLNDVNCLRENRNIFSSLQPENLNETLGMTCPKCLPSCSEETYSIQSSEIRMDNYRKGLNYSNYVALKVHFKDITCLKYRRDVFMSWDGLFAAFGGIFGLCMGGSVISLVEFFYYFTFKFCNYLRSHQLKLDVSRKLQQHNTSATKFKFHQNGVNLTQEFVLVGSANGQF